MIEWFARDMVRQTWKTGNWFLSTRNTYHSHSWYHYVQEFSPLIHSVRDQTYFNTKPPITTVIGIILEQILATSGTYSGTTVGYSILHLQSALQHWVILTMLEQKYMRWLFYFAEGKADTAGEPKDMKIYSL